MFIEHVLAWYKQLSVRVCHCISLQLVIARAIWLLSSHIDLTFSIVDSSFIAIHAGIFAEKYYDVFFSLQNIELKVSTENVDFNCCRYIDSSLFYITLHHFFVIAIFMTDLVLIDYIVSLLAHRLLSLTGICGPEHQGLVGRY